MKYGNLTLGQIEAGINKIGGEEAFMRLLRDELVVSEPTSVASLIPDIFRLTVDYGLSLEQMIAAGQYGWRNRDITEKWFPISGEGVVEFEVGYFNFGHDVSSETAVATMEKSGWRPAKIEHLLCFGEKFSEEQLKFPVVALGSVASVFGHRRVPRLHRDVSELGLDLGWFDRVWYPPYRFLAVREVSGS